MDTPTDMILIQAGDGGVYTFPGPSKRSSSKRPRRRQEARLRACCRSPPAAARPLTTSSSIWSRCSTPRTVTEQQEAEYSRELQTVLPRPSRSAIASDSSGCTSNPRSPSRTPNVSAWTSGNRSTRRRSIAWTPTSRAPSTAWASTAKASGRSSKAARSPYPCTAATSG